MSETATNQHGSTVNSVWYKPGVSGAYRLGHVVGVVGLNAEALPNGKNY